MATALEAVHEVREALAEHFDRSAEPVRAPEQVMEMTGLDKAAAEDALAVLQNKGEIEGTDVAELAYPPIVTGYRHAC